MTLNAVELCTLIEHLGEQWQTHGLEAATWHQPAARKGRRFVGSDVARVAVVNGFARQVHTTATGVLLLIGADMPNAAIPLVRQMYECAMSAIWLIQSEDDHGIKAMLDEHSRGRIAIQRDARQAVSAVFREGADEIANTSREPFVGSLDSVRNFEQICGDLSPGGKDAYIYYRLLSTFSHASLGVADMYYDSALPEDSSTPQQRRHARQPIEPKTLLFFSAISMVWSARAFTYSSRSTVHRRVLRDAARQLEINPEIGLSDQYRKRHSAARRTPTTPAK